MGGYYRDNLSAIRLRQCYEIAPPRVKQYLEANIAHVQDKITPHDIILELGCGYGRILKKLALKVRRVIGIDTSLSSLLFGQEILRSAPNCYLINMNAVQLAFRDCFFDCVICIQNGISAFHVNNKDLIKESIRVTKPGGKILFSSYSDKFWEYRLEWFKLQSEAGLLGKINAEKAREGIIECDDGFEASTIYPEQFLSLTAELDVDTKIVEVDDSSLFCEITPRPKP